MVKKRMVNPVPGKSVTTAYHKNGSHWTACGWHTGQDYAAPSGTKVVAARPGTAKHVNYGSSFGKHQLAVQCSDGTEDFYAHMKSRVANGTKVDAGEWVGYVGNEGNSTGPHLHFERHKVKNTWNCGNMQDPMKSHNYKKEEEDMPLSDADIEKIAKAVNRTLGDWNADGTEQDAASDPPQTASTRLRSIAKKIEG
jgi:murein DD-endopeptidase MepM/ murein hydrolase activator NlpD